MQNSRTGIDVLIGPGVKPNTEDRCPCWKTQTMTPNTAPIVSALRTSALTGSSTLPVNRNSKTRVVRTIQRMACGSLEPIADFDLMSSAGDPPRYTLLVPGGGMFRTSWTIV